jgi:hypothetical protein
LVTVGKWFLRRRRFGLDWNPEERTVTDRRRSPEDARAPLDPDHIAMVNDMGVVPEDVRGADVVEVPARYTLDEAADMLDAEGQRLLDERGEHYVGRWESAKWLRSVGEARTPNISGGNDLPDADGANPRTPKRADEREALSFPHAPYVWEHPNPGFGYEIRVADMTEDGYTTLAQGIPTSRIAHVFLAALRSPEPAAEPNGGGDGQ